MLLDFSRSLLCRFGKSEANAAASVHDDAQSGGIEDSPKNGEADEEEHDVTGKFSEHVNE